MRVVITGSKHWTFDRYIEDEIVRLEKESRLRGKKLLVIHGGEPGPESIADEVCKVRGIDRIVHPAVRALGDNCFYRRNELMLLYHRPDLALVFVRNLQMSKVCADMLRRARAKGIKTRLVDFDYLNRKRY